MPATGSWNISYCAGYVVPSCKGYEPKKAITRIKGSTVELGTEVIDYFHPLFINSPNNCKIDIVFSPTQTQPGEYEQQNPIRDLVRKIAFGTSEQKASSAKELALQLALVSDRRTPTGLFVVLTGISNARARVVLFKFPADESLQAIFSKEGLSIRVVKGAFSRKTKYFKAAIFEDTDADTTFWKGKVEDKQANSRIYEVSDLWAIKFLQAKPELTSVRGTRLLAKALRGLIEKTKDAQTQQSLVAAAITITSQEDRNISLREFAAQYLPSEARRLFLDELRAATLTDAIFRVDAGILKEQLGVRMIILDSGFSVIGPLNEFENSNVINIVPQNIHDFVEITLRGRIIDQKIKTTRSLPQGR